MIKKILLLSIMLLAFSISVFSRVTPPPSEAVTLDPEWSEMEGIIMRYPWYPWMSWLIFPTFAQIIDGVQDYGVAYILAADENTAQDCLDDLAGEGVPGDNIEFIYYEEDENDEWLRDYGPIFIREEDGSLSIVDMGYYQPEPVNDFFPEFLEYHWGMDYYGTEMIHEGGNMMTDGHGTMMMTSVIFRRNPDMTTEDVNQVYHDYFGQDTVYILENFPDDPLGHIDGWAKIMNDTTILVARLDPDDPNYQLVEDNAVIMSQIPTVYGTPFNVVRVQYPDPWWYCYSNSLLFNGLALVPVYGFEELDQQALEVYEEILGADWEVRGINCYWLAQLGGTIHCTTMEVPRHDDDYLVEADLTFEPVNPPIIIPAEGGSFDFTVVIENLEEDTILYDYWTDIALPDGRIYGPVFKRERIRMPEFVTYSREMTQAVPAGAPVGIYSYNAYIGSYLPLVVSAEASFTFEKTAASDGGAEVDEWRVSGDEFEERFTVELPIVEVIGLVTAFPNPFNVQTTISFNLPASGRAELKVFNITGREVESLVTGHWSLGRHEVVWNAEGVASGVYFVQLTVNREPGTGNGNKLTAVRKVVLIK